MAITPSEFGAFDKYLVIAIAGAVNGFATLKNTQTSLQKAERLDTFALEFLNVLTSVKQSLEMARSESDAFNGEAGKMLERGLMRFEEILNRVRSSTSPQVRPN